MRRVLSGMSSNLTGNQAAKTIHLLIIASACIASLGLGGCGFGQPRRRLGCYATSTPGTRFISSDKLGRHSYTFSLFERNGITYTCNAGHIDITHLRIAADNTKDMSEKLYKGILAGRTDFTFGLVADQSKHVVKLSYPDNWQQVDKEHAAREISLQLGQYLAFSATTWHEMLTWFGYRTMVIIPEFSSAFSWEDVYSNLIGTSIAAEAIRNSDHKYNKAMTLAINQEMERLGGQSARVAKKAAQMVRGQWFTGNLMVKMKKRNLDIGVDDGFVTPMIVPGICDQARPEHFPVPSPDVSQYGFSMDYHIVPREFERGKILRIVHANRKAKTITPQTHFAPIMAHITNVAIQKFGPQVAIAYDPDKIRDQEPTRIAVAAKVKKFLPLPVTSLPKTKTSKPAKTRTVATANRYTTARVNNSIRGNPGLSQIIYTRVAKQRGTPGVANKPGIKQQKPSPVITPPRLREYDQLRVTIPPKVENYDKFQKLLKSSSKNDKDYMQRLWAFGLKKNGEN